MINCRLPGDSPQADNCTGTFFCLVLQNPAGSLQGKGEKRPAMRFNQATDKPLPRAYALPSYIWITAVLCAMLLASCQFGQNASELNKLGHKALVRGEMDSAEQFFRQAAEKGNDEESLAEALDELFILYRRQDRLADLEPFLRAQIEQRKRSLAQEDPQVFVLLSKLAQCYLFQRELAKAEDSGRQALLLGERLFGTDSARLASPLNTIIASACAGGRCVDLESQWLQMLAIRRKSCGKDNPDTVMTMCQLGELYRKKGRTGEAAAIYIEALRIRRAQRSPLVGATLLALGQLAEDEGNYRQAELYLKEADELERKCSETHVTLLPAVLNELKKLQECQRKLKPVKSPKFVEIR